MEKTRVHADKALSHWELEYGIQVYPNHYVLFCRDHPNYMDVSSHVCGTTSYKFKEVINTQCKVTCLLIYG